MIQNVSFGRLHISREDNKYLDRLINNPKEEKALAKACAKIHAASGDKDVYLTTSGMGPSGSYNYALRVDNDNGKAICFEHCLEGIDNQKKFRNLALEFIEKFNPDFKNTETKNDKADNCETLDDLFDYYV